MCYLSTIVTKDFIFYKTNINLLWKAFILQTKWWIIFSEIFNHLYLRYFHLKYQPNSSQKKWRSIHLSFALVKDLLSFIFKCYYLERNTKQNLVFQIPFCNYSSFFFTIFVVSCFVSMELYKLVDIWIEKHTQKRHESRKHILFDIFRRNDNIFSFIIRNIKMGTFWVFWKFQLLFRQKYH